MLVIYLDSHATTPLDPEVADGLRSWFEPGTIANTGSPNAAGEEAAEAVQRARADLAALVNGTPSRLIFTSGATESNNLCLAVAGRHRHPHVITSPMEHPSVLEPLRAAQDSGEIDVDLVDINSDGAVTADSIERLIRPTTALLSFQAANNETGILNPVAEIGRVAADHGLLFHCDGAQAVGKVPIDSVAGNIDFLTISGHKFYGPLGAGAVVASQRGLAALTPQLLGGGQESGFRSGTVNVPAAVGLGLAARIASRRMSEDGVRLARLRDDLQQSLSKIPGSQVNGSGQRLPGSMSIRFSDVPAEALVASCPEIAMSSGSACSTGSPAPSPVLLAMGLTAEEADETIRLGLHRDVTESDVQAAGDILTKAIDRVRSLVHA
jgi:cysteine desulfurase